MTVAPVVRPRAQPWGIVDGDTYDLLVNWRGGSKWLGASVERVRLRDYSAPERSQAEQRDGAGNVTLVSGADATRIAGELLRGADQTLVEFRGNDDRGRGVCWVWIDGRSLGAELVERKAARPGAFVGEA